MIFVEGQEITSEPWGRRLWSWAAVIALLSACLLLYGITSWPMADDEVPSLVEMGLSTVPAQAFSVPASQIGRLPRAVPVWYKTQRLLITLLPGKQLAFRLPSVIWGLLSTILAFIVAARWRGLWFAVAVAIMMNFSQPFVYLSQLDRFYSMPLLFMLIALTLVWTTNGGAASIVTIAVVTSLAVLSHNITLTIFVLAFGASCVLFVIGRAPLQLAINSGVCAVVSAAIYLFYLRPLVGGWTSTGNPTPVLISLSAHAGIPTLALALFGCVVALVDRDRRGAALWWSIIFVTSLGLLQFTSLTWNPRYFLFFLPAMWVLGALSMEYVARRVGHPLVGVAYFGCTVLLLSPNLVSHYIDGSRHDYREAARVLVETNTATKPILSDDAETISYYLPESMRMNLYVRTKVKEFPESEFYLVARSNAWMPLPQIPNRRMQLLSEIYRRRFDEFSHILRVYRVEAREAD